MRVSDKGLRRIARFEGFVDHPYKPVKGEQFWTWGYGHFGIDVPKPRVVNGRHQVTISKQHALHLLRKDISTFEAGVSALLKTKVNQNRFDALVSLAFNIGLGNFANSTVLRETNNRRFLRAAAAFRMWTRGGAPLRTLPGLVLRRAREARVYLTPVPRKR